MAWQDRRRWPRRGSAERESRGASDRRARRTFRSIGHGSYNTQRLINTKVNYRLHASASRCASRARCGNFSTRRRAGILSSRGSLSKSERNLQNKFLEGLWLRDEPSGPLTMNIRVPDAIDVGSAEPAPQFRLLALLESRVKDTQRNNLCTAVEDGPMLAWLAKHGGPATRLAVAAN